LRFEGPFAERNKPVRRLIIKFTGSSRNKNTRRGGKRQKIAFKITIPLPISIDGTQPSGFLAHLQSHQCPTSGLDPEIILSAVGRKWPTVFIDIKLDALKRVHSFAAASSSMEPLVQYFDKFTKAQANLFAQLANDNSQIWGSFACAESHLPNFLRINEAHVDSNLYADLLGKVKRVNKRN
jgi:hypothetical protein